MKNCIDHYYGQTHLRGLPNLSQAIQVLSIAASGSQINSQLLIEESSF